MIFVSYAWFYQGGGWNQNSRFDLTRALVERGSLCIDAYVSNTGDFAEYHGHYYSDKAPGAAFTALPVVALLHGLGQHDPVIQSYFATLMAACLPGALAAVLVYACAIRLGFGPASGLFASLCVAWGTPFWCYASMMFGHALAAACLTAAFYLAVRSQGGVASGLGLGLCCGWAVTSEYSTLPHCTLVVLWALARNAEGRARLALGVGLGGLFCSGILGLYHHQAFGQFFGVGYAHLSAFPEMSRGFFGLSWPRPPVIYELLFGSYRGLFHASPIMLASLWGLASSRGGALRMVSVLVLIQVLLAAAFAYWDGGWAYGPRHLMQVVPLFGLGLAPVYQRASRGLRLILLAVAGLCMVMNLAAVSTLPMPPQARAELAGRDPALYQVWRHPLRSTIWPAFLAGDLALNTAGVEGPQPRHRQAMKPRAAWNLGQRLGLRGLVSLLPLVCLVAALAVFRVRHPIGWGWLSDPTVWQALPVLAVALACLPLVAHSELPRSSDASYHLQGISNMAASLREGKWFPRWVADCNGGYGAPIFVFYPPLGSLSGASLAVLTGSALEAFRWSWVFWLAASALSFYLSALPLYGERAASLGACLYTLLPYHLFDLYDRGALGEFVGMVWLPPLLALCESGPQRRLQWLALVLVMVALLLSHPMLAMLSAVAWTGWAVLRRSQVGLPVLSALVLALGMSAFYWLPMLLETPLVQLEQHFAGDHYHWQRNLLFRQETEFGYQPDVCKPWATLAATTTLLLTLGGMALAPETGRPWATLSLLSFILQTPVSAPLWGYLPWLYKVQFPWRFGALQLAGCCLLWCALLKAHSGRRTLYALAILAVPALVGAAVLSLKARPYDLGPALAESATYRQRSVPEYTPRLAQGTSLEQASPFWSDVLIEGRVESWEQQRRKLSVRLEQPGPVWVRTLAYPGWKASLDKQPAPLLPGALLGVSVPAGLHSLEFSFESTSRRRAAGWLSLAAAGIWLGVLLKPERKST